MAKSTGNGASFEDGDIDPAGTGLRRCIDAPLTSARRANGFTLRIEGDYRSPGRVQGDRRDRPYCHRPTRTSDR